VLASQPLVHQQVAIDNLSDSDWDVIVDPITYFVVVTFHNIILIVVFLLSPINIYIAMLSQANWAEMNVSSMPTFFACVIRVILTPTALNLYILFSAVKLLPKFLQAFHIRFTVHVYSKLVGGRSIFFNSHNIFSWVLVLIHAVENYLAIQLKLF